MKTVFAISLIFMSVLCMSQPIDIRFRPDSVVYLYETKGSGSARDLYTGVIQNIAIVNTSLDVLIVERASLLLSKAGNEISTKQISKKAMLSDASKFNALQNMGLLELYDFQFQTLQYLKGIALAAHDTLYAGQALIITHQVFLTDEAPDALELKVVCKTTNNHEVLASKKLKVSNYQSKNKYHFPLKGRWTVAAAPSLISHHRWASIQEFAFDFIKIGEGNLSHKGTGERLADYYGYGAPVYAVADGTVVSALNTQAENKDLLKMPEEDEAAYFQRVIANQQKLLEQGFHYILGNHLIIRHANGEYSFYLHLKQGSVVLKPGDFVKQGDAIAALGHSGNSTEPHLHFHMADSPDFINCRSLPIRFSNIKLFPDDDGRISHVHSGQIVIAE